MGLVAGKDDACGERNGDCAKESSRTGKAMRNNWCMKWKPFTADLAGVAVSNFGG